MQEFSSNLRNKYTVYQCDMCLAQIFLDCHLEENVHSTNLFVKEVNCMNIIRGDEGNVTSVRIPWVHSFTI